MAEELKQLFSNDKADELIDAIINASSDYSEGFKHALLNIAANVAYTNNRGSEYYSDLYAVLYPEPEPSEPYTWEYNPRTDGMIVSGSNYTVSNNGSINASINEYALRLSSTYYDGSVFDVCPSKATNQKASMFAKVKINTVPATANEYVGWRMQLSNGTSGVQIGTVNQEGTLYLGTVEGNNMSTFTQINFEEWYDIEIKINGAKGDIYINGRLVKTVNSLSTYYCTYNRMLCNVYTSSGAAGTTLDVSIAKLAYRDED